VRKGLPGPLLLFLLLLSLVFYQIAEYMAGPRNLRHIFALRHVALFVIWHRYLLGDGNYFAFKLKP
jgi:hypothetical protein